MASGRWRCRVGWIVTALATACASSNDLATSPPVQIIQTPGGLTFARGDQRYEDGLFGHGLREAVDGVPAAERHAHAHSQLLLGGFLLDFASMLLAGAAIASVAQSDDSGEALDTALALAGGAVVLSVASSVIVESSTPHAWQAVGTYNHEVQRATIEKTGAAVARPGENTSMLQRGAISR